MNPFSPNMRPGMRHDSADFAHIGINDSEEDLFDFLLDA
jgi:hypothetical protein